MEDVDWFLPEIRRLRKEGKGLLMCIDLERWLHVAQIRKFSKDTFQRFLIGKIRQTLDATKDSLDPTPWMPWLCFLTTDDSSNQGFTVIISAPLQSYSEDILFL